MAEAPTYKVDDRSIFLPYYRRFLINPALPRIPAKVDPNTITHLGHALCLAALLVTLACRMSAGWPTLLVIVLLQAYVWCDNADGAHARATGQQSAAGEYLDHGLDLVNCAYIGIISAYGLGSSTGTLGLILASLIAVASSLTTWEQSVTGVFRLGMVNQIESIFFLGFVLLADGIFGPEILTRVALFGVTLQQALFLAVSLSVVFTVARGMFAVRASGGTVLPGAGLLLLHGAIVFGHARGAIAVSAVLAALATTSVAFGARTLLSRLRGTQLTASAGLTLLGLGGLTVAAAYTLPLTVVSAGMGVLALLSVVAAGRDALGIARHLETSERAKSLRSAQLP